MDKKVISELDLQMTKTVHNMSPELSEYIRNKTCEIQPQLFNKGTSQLELIVDTNILFQEVRSLMTTGSSFFLKIIENPYIKVFGPSQLEEELFEKIKLKFPKEKKTKDLDISDCLVSANILLSKVTINDEISQKAYKKAESHLIQRDKDDINFLALNFSLNTHGIITKDKDISDIEEVKTWKLKDAGEVITKIHKGSMSFIILSSSNTAIYKIISYLTKTIWKGVLSLFEGLIAIFKSIISGSISSISKIPPEILTIGGFGLVIIMHIKKLREGVSDFITLIWDEIKKVLSTFREIFEEIWGIFRTILKALKPLFDGAMEVYTYYMEQSLLAITELERLETSRANNLSQTTTLEH